MAPAGDPLCGVRADCAGERWPPYKPARSLPAGGIPARMARTKSEARFLKRFSKTARPLLGSPGSIGSLGFNDPSNTTRSSGRWWAPSARAETARAAPSLGARFARRRVFSDRFFAFVFLPLAENGMRGRAAGQLLCWCVACRTHYDTRLIQWVVAGALTLSTGAKTLRPLSSRNARAKGRTAGFGWPSHAPRPQPVESSSVQTEKKGNF